MEDHLSTTTLTQKINEGFRGAKGPVTLAEVRRELISLHHLGLIKIVGIRYDEDHRPGEAVLYFRDYVWTKTKHSDHEELEPSCQACRRRQEMLLAMGPLADPLVE
jgi:hypothetical protein